MSLLKDVIGSGLHAARPAAGSEGRLYYETDTATLLRDNGTTWDALSLGGTSAVVPVVRCYNSVSITIFNASSSVLTFDTNRIDQGTTTAQHSTSSDTSRLVCQQDGVYQITGHVSITGNPTGQRSLWINLNGTTSIAEQTYGPQGTPGLSLTVTTLYPLTVGDYVELFVYQDSGGSLDVTAVPAKSPEFSMVRVA